MIEFVSNFYVITGIATMVGILASLLIIIGVVRKQTKYNRDIKRHRTPIFGRGGKLPKPEKKRRFVWQPEQDYEVITHNLSSNGSSHTTTTLVPKDKTKRR
ncbi:MAG: hypothetical protein ABJQ85_13630 [Rhizobiaceae bacterium]